jgi:hypothetical protein
MADLLRTAQAGGEVDFLCAGVRASAQALSRSYS